MFTAFEYPESARPKKPRLEQLHCFLVLGDGRKYIKLQDKSQLIGFVSLKF
jgi:hypothetical protein